MPAASSGEKDESVEHNSPSDDFSAFIESASESDDDESPVVATGDSSLSGACWDFCAGDQSSC